MQKQLKKYFSVLFFFLLFFPLVEKQIHAFEHSDDIHCSSSDKHFHEQEHSCSICDYNSTDSNSATNNDLHILISVVSFNFCPLSESIHAPEAFKDIPSRAPPTV